MYWHDTRFYECISQDNEFSLAKQFLHFCSVSKRYGKYSSGVDDIYYKFMLNNVANMVKL